MQNNHTIFIWNKLTTVVGDEGFKACKVKFSGQPLLSTGVSLYDFFKEFPPELVKFNAEYTTAFIHPSVETWLRLQYNVREYNHAY
jgi:hypothetical protein